MSAEMMSTNPEPKQEEEFEDAVATKIKSINEEDWNRVYGFFLQSFGINRHSSPAYQMKCFLLVDREVIENLLDLAIKSLGDIK